VQEDRSVLVLGVGPEEGLGVALCKAFAAEGYSVFGCGRSEENMDALNKIKTDKGKITGLVGDVTKEKDLFEGECFVFDKRVALNHELEKGSYSICHACGMPVSIQDQKRKEYRKGIQCHFCINQFSDDDRKRFEERQKHFIRLKVENHKIHQY